MRMLAMIRNFFGGEERTALAKKNILASLIFKVVDIPVYLALVPVTINYLNEYEYGIWLTLSSIILWIDTFDIGLGNGLRNKLGSAIAKNDYNRGRAYVSTTLVILISIALVITIIGLFLIPRIDWYKILNVTLDSVPNLVDIVLATFVLFCANFVMKFVGNVYQALQLSAVTNLITLSSHILSLVVIFLLTKFCPSDLLYVAIVFSSSSLIIYVLLYLITFYKFFKNLSPSFRYFRKEYVKDIYGLSVRFFLLQIAGLILFSVTNLLISNLFDPSFVTPYNLSYRYFSIVSIAASFVTAPMWSASTDAYAKGDLLWIYRTSNQIVKVNLCATLLVALMLVISPFAYKLWLGSNVDIPFSLSIIVAIYVCITFWSVSFSSYLNGMGKLKVQTCNTLVVAALFIPVCYTLGSLIGIEGIVLGMTLLNMSGLILNIIQFKKIINNNARGIWNM